MDATGRSRRPRLYLYVASVHLALTAVRSDALTPASPSTPSLRHQRLDPPPAPCRHPDLPTAAPPRHRRPDPLPTDPPRRRWTRSAAHCFVSTSPAEIRHLRPPRRAEGGALRRHGEGRWQRPGRGGAATAWRRQRRGMEGSDCREGRDGGRGRRGHVAMGRVERAGFLQKKIWTVGLNNKT